MKLIKSIPNIITSLNLFAGSLAIIMVFQEKLHVASLFIGIAAIFDFLDGFTARILKAYSEIGKQLDSLADVISFGLAPSFILYGLMINALNVDGFNQILPIDELILLCLPFLIVIFSALRLAKFNIDTNQTTNFIGLPTPANAILIASLPVLLWYYNYSFLDQVITNQYFLIILILVQSFLLVSNIKMFSLKFSNFSFRDNKIRFVFLGISLILILAIQLFAIPTLIILYIVLSLVSKQESQKLLK